VLQLAGAWIAVVEEVRATLKLLTSKDSVECCEWMRMWSWPSASAKEGE